MVVTDNGHQAVEPEPAGRPTGWRLSTTHPRALLWMAAVMAVAALALGFFVGRISIGGGIAVGLIFLADATFMAYAARWSLRHPDQAGLNVDRAVKERDDAVSAHPVLWSVSTALLAGFSFPARTLGHEHASLTAWLVVGALGAAFGLALVQVVLWRARRKRSAPTGGS